MVCVMEDQVLAVRPRVAGVCEREAGVCERERLCKGTSVGVTLPLRSQSVAMVTLPFRCPRCGENTRFRCLTSLRAHLQFGHAFPCPPVLKAPPITSHHWPEHHNLSRHWPEYHTFSEAQPITTRPEDKTHQSAEPISPGVAFSTAPKVRPPPSLLAHSRKEGSLLVDSKEAGLQRRLWLADSKGEGSVLAESKDPSPSLLAHSKEASLQRRLWLAETKEAGLQKASILADRKEEGLQRRLWLADSKEAGYLLADTEEEAGLGLQRRLWLALKRAEEQLQSEHAQWEQRSLRREIHAAAMVIASLRQQLAVSQEQLEQRESEVSSMQTWLSLAAQHELYSKEKLQTFIETLLQRLETT